MAAPPYGAAARREGGSSQRFASPFLTGPPAAPFPRIRPGFEVDPPRVQFVPVPRAINKTQTY